MQKNCGLSPFRKGGMRNQTQSVMRVDRHSACSEAHNAARTRVPAAAGFAEGADSEADGDGRHAGVLKAVQKTLWPAAARVFTSLVPPPRRAKMCLAAASVFLPLPSRLSREDGASREDRASREDGAAVDVATEQLLETAGEGLGGDSIRVSHSFAPAPRVTVIFARRARPFSPGTGIATTMGGGSFNILLHASAFSLSSSSRCELKGVPTAAAAAAASEVAAVARCSFRFWITAQRGSRLPKIELCDHRQQREKLCALFPTPSMATIRSPRSCAN
mmetsp:Transcript_14019/g.24108  ORF Transcript_14019/g.24108 Transcript_14019/m.24108 type:complete len:276 (-) Transcript_14019:693-1520(-)